MNVLRTLENGHKQCTTCVETTNHDQCMIITGAERGELCLWSAKDGNLIKSLRLKKRDDVSGIACSKLKPEHFFVSAYRQILSFDLRQLNKPLEKVAYSGDCINQISLNEPETRLALALDSGEVEIFDLQKKCFSHVLEEHSNICNTVAFQSNQLFSGGMDNLLIRWNVEEEKVEKKIDLVELSSYSEDMGPLPFFVVSPPFVHSLSVSRSCRHLACGTENAMVYLFDTSGDELNCIKSFRRHNKGVSQVHFPKFSDDILLSAGNDFRLCAWKIPEFPECPIAENEGPTEVKQGMSSPCLETMRTEKTNWIATGLDGSNGFVVTVDSTMTPTMYSFPS